MTQDWSLVGDESFNHRFCGCGAYVPKGSDCAKYGLLLNALCMRCYADQY